jgi:hypothetical protein
MEELSIDGEYCKYCGKDVEKGHSIHCPLAYGIKVNTEGYVVFGLKADPNDMEWNLHQGRMTILLDKILETGRRDAAGRVDLVTDDKKIVKRLTYESAKFVLNRVNENLYALRSEESNFLKRLFIQRKINHLEKVKSRVREFAKAGLPPKKVEDFFLECSVEPKRRSM